MYDQTKFDFNTYEDYFHTTLIFPGTWRIDTKSQHTPFGCDCYLLEGDECAIAIDSGMTTLNIYEYMKNFTDLPIKGVISTHSHFDHTGGNGWFPEVFMHPRAEKGAKTAFGSTEGFKLDYPITPLAEGDTIDLGSRVLEIIEIPAHDAGSIAILDKTNGILFSGDELESGWCNVGTFGSTEFGTIENHYNNMLKLKARFEEYDWICPAHHGAPLDKEFLNHVLICDRMILEGVEGDPNTPEKNGGGRFKNPDMRSMRYKCAHIGYNVNNIWNKK